MIEHVIGSDPDHETDFEGAILLEGLDEAIVGSAINSDFDRVLVYSSEKIIELLMKRDEMKRSDALEYYSFHINAGYGSGSPLFLNPVKVSALYSHQELWQRSKSAVA